MSPSRRITRYVEGRDLRPVPMFFLPGPVRQETVARPDVNPVDAAALSADDVRTPHPVLPLSPPPQVEGAAELAPFFGDRPTAGPPAAQARSTRLVWNTIVRRFLGATPPREAAFTAIWEGARLIVPMILAAHGASTAWAWIAIGNVLLFVSPLEHPKSDRAARLLFALLIGGYAAAAALIPAHGGGAAGLVILIAATHFRFDRARLIERERPLSASADVARPAAAGATPSDGRPDLAALEGSLVPRPILGTLMDGARRRRSAT